MWWEYDTWRVSVQHHLVAKAQKTEVLCGFITTEAWTVPWHSSSPPPPASKKKKNPKTVKWIDFQKLTISRNSASLKCQKSRTWGKRGHSNHQSLLELLTNSSQRNRWFTYQLSSAIQPHHRHSPQEMSKLSNKSCSLNRKWFFSWGCLKKKQAAVSQMARSEMTVLLTHLPREVLWLDSSDLLPLPDLQGQGQVVKLRLYKGDGDVTVCLGLDSGVWRKTSRALALLLQRFFFALL